MNRRLIITIVLAALAAFGVSALLINIFQRKQEARTRFFRTVELTEEIDDPAVWGRDFPLQYDDYKKTVDQQRTRYGGSEALPHSPTKADPRAAVSHSKLEEDPRLKTMWAGYAFATDFREERGHAFMLIDQRHTQRVLDFKQPGTCLNCHASMVKAYRTQGNGDVLAGFQKINMMSYADATKLVQHPVSCIDCHNPSDMKLRVTRPAFVEGIRAVKAGQGIKDYDVNSQASTQEMRSFVCGQCHVEYYFKGAEKSLTYPWAKGLKVDEIYQYYIENPHTDWTHAETGAPVLKAQHPEFEMWNQGIHARSGVACADCHMPYKRVGASKVSDHHVQSPVLNINRACQSCHHFSEDEMKARVEQIQSRFQGMRDLAMDALVDLIADIKIEREKGATEAQLKEAWEFQRRAQFYLDMVEADNSSGFHAPQEEMRVLAESVDFARKGQKALRQIRPIARTALTR
jgi:nitrite reductase (cytochrome c-552)